MIISNLMGLIVLCTLAHIIFSELQSYVSLQKQFLERERERRSHFDHYIVLFACLRLIQYRTRIFSEQIKYEKQTFGKVMTEENDPYY